MPLDSPQISSKLLISSDPPRPIQLHSGHLRSAQLHSAQITPAHTTSAQLRQFQTSSDHLSSIQTTSHQLRPQQLNSDQLRSAQTHLSSAQNHPIRLYNLPRLFRSPLIPSHDGSAAAAAAHKSATVPRALAGVFNLKGSCLSLRSALLKCLSLARSALSSQANL